MNTSNIPFWAVILPSVVAIVVSLYNVYHTRKVAANSLAETKRHNMATIEEARLRKQEEFVEQALVEFYFPVQGYLQVTKSLNHLLKADKPERFRLFTYLLDPTQTYELNGNQVRVDLSSTDMELVGEIIDVERKIEEIFLTKGGWVDDPSLLSNYEPNPDITDVSINVDGIGLIPLAVSHFRVLRMAHEGKLKGTHNAYAQFVFPRELPSKITENLDKLRDLTKTLVNEHLDENCG